MKNSTAETETAGRPRWMIVDDNRDVLAWMSELVTKLVDADIQCFDSPHSLAS